MNSRRIVLTVIFLVVAGAAGFWLVQVCCSSDSSYVWVLQPAASCQLDGDG
jgi:hypothetical protein